MSRAIPVLVVPVLTGAHLLLRMINSIDYPVDHLLVIDNGRTSGQFDKPDLVDRVDVVTLPANLGVAGSWNLGVKATPFADWWLITNHDVEWAPGVLAEFASLADPDRVVLGGCTPPWSAFTLGSRVVSKVGLFDEALHPAYFEDNDYERRCTSNGISVLAGTVPFHHDNSSTLKSGYHRQNQISYQANWEYYQAKVARGDLSEGRWDLMRRRALSWD